MGTGASARKSLQQNDFFLCEPNFGSFDSAEFAAHLLQCLLGIQGYVLFDTPPRRFLGRMAPALWALCSASALGDGGPAPLREALCLPSRRSLPSLPQWWAEVASFLHGVCGRDWALLILARRFPFARGRRYRRCADKCLRCADICPCLPSPCLQKSDSRVAPPSALRSTFRSAGSYSFKSRQE